ncbi:MAG: hypothetical protein JXN64_08485 [Spirochaetes bacterium]|nr:hypothetical protein [Spirochaetota bacterium]
MRIINIIITAVIIQFLSADIVHSKNLSYKDFALGNRRKNIITILNKQKYIHHSIFYESNDRYINGIKVKPENSIKIIIKNYMEKEEILLVFDNNDLLFDIYTKKKPIDIRDYVDYRISLIETYGRPVEEQTVNGKYILAWSLNKKRNAVYLIYDSVNENLIINIRDAYLNSSYEPAIEE